MGIDAEMFVKITKDRLSEAQVKRLAFELGSAYGPQRFWIFKPDENRAADRFRHAATLIDKYTQDGPTLRPQKGEQFIEIHPATRYYGIGYERGDLPFLISLAEWLERRLPNCEVWYGGDSSGVCAERFDAVERAMLFAHFVEHGHRPYRGAFGSHLDPQSRAKVCPYCDEPMTQYGFGQSFQSFTCDGCGEQTETRDSGETWTKPKKDSALV